MLLVSSLDVFDCCGLELGGECPYPDPNREEDGRGDSGVICSPTLRKARVPLPAREHAWPGHGGKFGLLLGTPTNPALAPSLYPESNGQTAGTGMRTLVLTRSLGSLRTLLYFGDPLCMLHRHLASRSTAWKIQETGQPSPALRSLSRGPGHCLQKSWRKEERHWWGKGRLAAACPPKEGTPALAFSQFPLLGAALEGLMSSDH